MAGVSTLIGLCVPHMGMHSLLTSELESKETFRGSMVVGYYHGKPVFVEPMVTRAMLMEKRSFDLPIPDIPGLSGAHPTKFHAEYDKQREAYLNVGHRHRGAGKQHRDVAAQQIGDRGRAPFIRHVDDIDAGLHLQEFGAQLIEAADAA